MTGGTGLVGTTLADELASQGHQITILTRSVAHRTTSRPNISHVSGEPTRPGPWQNSVPGHHAVVNLAGQSIYGRWSQEEKRRIWESRILTTRNLAEALGRSTQDRPSVFLSASGAGYYGPTGDEEIDEGGTPGRDFLALLSREWEAEAEQARDAEVRVVLCRFGVVLAARGGALKQMLPLFKAGLGSSLGSGQQWFPWIHEEDLVNALSFLLERHDIEGPVNCVAPHPVRNRDFTRALAATLSRPHFLPSVPRFMLKLALGEFSSVLLTGQRAVPRKLMEAGFEFVHPTIEAALQDLLRMPAA